MKTFECNHCKKPFEKTGESNLCEPCNAFFKNWIQEAKIREREALEEGQRQFAHLIVSTMRGIERKKPRCAECHEYFDREFLSSETLCRNCLRD